MATIDEFRKLEFRTAKIVKVDIHPNADRLFVVTVDLGTEQRQVVAGIKAWYTPEALVGKTVIVVVNLEPAVLRGVTSNGMILAASIPDPNTPGKPLEVVVLTPDKPVPPGCLIS